MVSDSRTENRMQARTALRQLRRGPGTAAVVAVDSGLGTAGAGFANLAALLDQPITWVETAPRTVSPDQWVAEVDRTELDVRAVFGFCSAASLALSLADRLGRDRERPPVVLFDPEIVGPRQLWYMHQRFLLPFRQEAGDLVGPEAVELTEAAVPADDEDLRVLATRLCAAYASVLRHVSRSLDLAEEITLDFTTRHRDMIAFMVAAAEQPASSTAPLAVLASETVPLPDLSAPRTVRFPVPAEDLLGTAAVAETITTLLPNTFGC